MKKLQKKTLLIGSLALILAITIGGSIAYLLASTEEVSNTFTAATLTTEIDEEIDGNVKNNVKVINKGNIDAYIRAVVVITWQNEEGEVWGTKPVEGMDYEITWTCDNWFKASDGFYYYKDPVAPGDSTKILFTGCQLKENVTPPNGYSLNVEIIGSGIQALGVINIDGEKVPAVVHTWSSGVSSINNDKSLNIITE